MDKNQTNSEEENETQKLICCALQNQLIFHCYFQNGSNFDESCFDKFSDYDLTLTWLRTKIQKQIEKQSENKSENQSENKSENQNENQKIHLAMINLKQRKWYYTTYTAQQAKDENELSLSDIVDLIQNNIYDNVHLSKEKKEEYIQISLTDDQVEFKICFQKVGYSKKKKQATIKINLLQEDVKEQFQGDQQIRVAELDQKNKELDKIISKFQQRIDDLEKQCQPNKRQVTILLHSQLKSNYVEDVLYHFSNVFSNEICRLEIVLRDDSAKFSVGICRDGVLEEISKVANSYIFEFPNGTLKRGLKQDSKALQVINYYPLEQTQIGIEVDIHNKLLTLYINGEKSFSVRLIMKWEKFSFFVQADEKIEKLNEIFDEEEKLLSY